ncbi:hypothetical protein K0M31_012880 [Melipona bicolor]|uniref:Uncharacterized protein n=1 Tax=Melipona bicolor TaxID=60889 RepID=A0AA40KGX5_9HYME|nr:hypothetical protein K0M31_012880 [Melipona bicolor]
MCVYFNAATKHSFTIRAYLLSFSPAECALSPNSARCTCEIITVSCEHRSWHDEPSAPPPPPLLADSLVPFDFAVTFLSYDRYKRESIDVCDPLLVGILAKHLRSIRPLYSSRRFTVTGQKCSRLIFQIVIHSIDNEK